MATPETMVDAEGHRGDGMQDAAKHAADDAEGDTGPRAPLIAGPGSEPGAEDHHAFEADVDDARALGPQAAEAGVRSAPRGAAPWTSVRSR